MILHKWANIAFAFVFVFLQLFSFCNLAISYCVWYILGIFYGSKYKLSLCSWENQFETCSAYFPQGSLQLSLTYEPPPSAKGEEGGEEGDEELEEEEEEEEGKPGAKTYVSSLL